MGTCLSISILEGKKVPKDLNVKELPEFIPPIDSGRVVKVYDGDTITVASKIPHLKNSQIYKFHIRLNGIDTPEIKGSNEEEKKIAKKARDALSEKIMNQYVFLKNVKTEKYGRLLCDVYLGNQNLNLWMLEQRYAVKYDGGTKKSPSSWEEYHLHNIII
jgi:endonuclease YncB( thermonuclease family)